MVYKQFTLILLFFVTSICNAAVNLDFQGVTISELSQLVIKGIIKRDYVLSPEVLGDNRKVSISLKNQQEKDVLPFFKGFLSDNGIDIVDRGAFLYVSKRQALSLPVDDNLYKNSNIPLDKPCIGCQTMSRLLDKNQPPQVADSVPVIPTFVYTYSPKFLSVEQLSAFIKFNDCQVLDSPLSDFLVYRTTKDNYLLISDLLMRVDKPQSDLLVKVFLYEVTTSLKTGSAFQAALSLLNSKLKLNVSNGALGANNLTISTSDFDAVISALDSDSRFKSLSSPSLRVKHGRLSRFAVGSEVPVLGALQQQVNGNPTQSVIYKPSGVILEVKPLIYEKNIELDLKQEISSFITTTTGVNNSPTLIKRELNTVLNVKDGDIVFMSGLDESRQNNQSSGFNLLPEFMKSKVLDDDKTDIFMVLQVTKI